MKKQHIKETLLSDLEKAMEEPKKNIPADDVEELTIKPGSNTDYDLYVKKLMDDEYCFKKDNISNLKQGNRRDAIKELGDDISNEQSPGNPNVNRMYRFRNNDNTPTKIDIKNNILQGDEISNNPVELQAGKYRFKNNDMSGNWNVGDEITIPQRLSFKKNILGKLVFEIDVNDTKAYITKDFLEKIENITEDEGGGGDVGGGESTDGGIMTSTNNISTYATPFTKNSVQKRKNPNMFLTDDEEVVEEDGSDFSWTWSKVKNPQTKHEQPAIDDDLIKKLKIHTHNS